MKRLKQIPKPYKIITLVFCIIVLLISAFMVLSRARLPVTPPAEPAFHDYFITILISSGKILLVTIVFTTVFSLFLLWLWCFTDIVKSRFKGENDKLIWFVLNLLLGLVGSLLYLSLGVKQKIGTPG